MKKKVKILLALTVILLLFVFVALFLCMQYNRYELSPMMCEAMLGINITPESFVANQGFETIIENAYTYAKVNDEGHLV